MILSADIVSYLMKKGNFFSFSHLTPHIPRNLIVHKVNKKMTSFSFNEVTGLNFAVIY